MFCTVFSAKLMFLSDLSGSLACRLTAAKGISGVPSPGEKGNFGVPSTCGRGDLWRAVYLGEMT